MALPPKATRPSYLSSNSRHFRAAVSKCHYDKTTQEEVSSKYPSAMVCHSGMTSRMFTVTRSDYQLTLGSLKFMVSFTFL